MLGKSENKAVWIPRLTSLVRRLGGPLGKEETIARQVWKRSEQLAVKHGIKQVEALDYLLRAMVSGTRGDPPPHPPWEKTSEDACGEKKE